MGEDFSDEVIEEAWGRAEGRCEICYSKLRWDDRGKDNSIYGWEAHHIKAKKEGGDGTLENCQILCIPCHKDTDSYGEHD